MITIYLFHLATQYPLFSIGSKLFQYLFSRGDIGVNLFFMMSTYGLCFSITNNSIGRFYYNRIKRIWPLYILFLLIIYKGWNVEILINLSGLSLFYDHIIHAWYIPATILLYFGFPIVFKIVRYVYLHSMLITILLCVTPIYIMYIYNGFYLSLALSRFPYMIVGILIFLSQSEPKRLYVVSIILSFLALVNLPENTYLAWLPLFVYISTSLNWRSKIIGYIGEHSLEVFFAQGLALMWFIQWSSSFILSIVVVTIAMVLLTMIFIFVNDLINRTISLFDRYG